MKQDFKKKGLVLIAVFFMSISVKGQIPYLHYPYAYLLPAPGPEKYFKDNQHKSGNDKQPGIRYGVQVGTSYMSFAGSHAFSSYFAPSLSYYLSPRFHLSGVIMLEHTFPVRGNNPAESAGNTFYLPMDHVVIYGQGTYFIRPSVSLTGTVVKNLNQDKNISPYYRNYIPDSYSLRLNYRISDNIFFGAEFRYSEPAVYSPFYPMNVPSYRGIYPYCPY